MPVPAHRCPSTSALSLAALAVILGSGFGPALAQDRPGDCARLNGTAEVECLRQVLSQTQDALNRAEQALEHTESRAPAASPPTLGAEQAARRTGIRPAPVEEERMITAIVAAERVHPNHLQVRLENGQIWRQIQGDTQFVDLSAATPTPAEIWRSGFGGYRMRLPQMRRVLKVERIR